jgi:hypothetical protein
MIHGGSTVNVGVNVRVERGVCEGAAVDVLVGKRIGVRVAGSEGLGEGSRLSVQVGVTVGVGETIS